MQAYYFHLTASLAITGATTLVLGLFVLSRRKDRLGVLFFLWFLSIAWWSLFELVIITRTNPQSALFWGRVTQAGDIFLPTLFVHFVCTLLALRMRPWRLTTLYVTNICFAALCFTPLVISEAAPRTIVPYFIVPGPLYIPMVIYFVGCVLYGQSKLLYAYLGASGQNRTRLGYFFWSSVLGYIGGCMSFLLVFNVEIPALYSYGTYTVPLFVAATTYAIVRYHLMDITVVIHKWLTSILLLAIILIPINSIAVIGHRATLYSIPPLFAGAIILTCGLWVVLQRPRSMAHRIFGMICAGICCWLLGMFMLYSSDREDEALILGKAVYIGVIYIPAFFYHFTVCLLQLRDRNPHVWPPYLISTLFLLLLPTAYLVDGQYRYFWGFYPKAGALHPLFLAYFAAVSGRSLWLLYTAARSAKQISPAEASRFRYVFLAFALGYLASGDFIPSYGVELYPVGYFFAYLWVAIVSYTILKHQLMDFTFSDPAAGVIPYRQLLALVPAYFVILLLLQVFTGASYATVAGILVATFVIFAGFLANLQKRMERAVEKALFVKRYDAYKTLTEFSKAMVTILDLKTLTNEIIQTLARVMGSRVVSLYFLDKEKAVFELKTARGFDRKTPPLAQLKANHPLPQYLQLAGQPILREALMQGFLDSAVEHVDLAAVTDTLARIEAEISIPLMNRECLIGFLNLGHKAQFEMYSEDDLNLLTTLAHNAAIALDNAFLFEDLRRQKAVMQRTDRLRSLETIAGGFAHEIRNPLTSIKTFVQLVPTRRDDPEFVGHFSATVAEDVDRIERLIQEILDYARYMEPKFTMQDLNEVVASCLYFIEVKAATKNIAVQQHLADDLPPVLLDRQQIRQVLLNLFLNAMDAMSERGGRLTVRTHRLMKPPGDGWVQVEVADTGSGIPPDDLQHIFDPFYSTKHESEEREGTGLGLTIVHQIVQEHHGHIKVESEVGRGTTFFVNLPVNSLPASLGKEPEVHEKTGSMDR